MQPLHHILLHLARLRVEALVEGLRRSEDLRVEEVEQRPQLVQVVLDGRARQQHAVRRRHGAGDLRKPRVFVLEPVRLIHHEEGPRDLAKRSRLEGEHLVPGVARGQAGWAARRAEVKAGQVRRARAHVVTHTLKVPGRSSCCTACCRASLSPCSLTTLSAGHHLANSRCQLPSTESGTMTKCGFRSSSSSVVTPSTEIVCAASGEARGCARARARVCVCRSRVLTGRGSAGGGGRGGCGGRLQRLAESHLIRENPVELTRSQREHPVEALDLRAHRHGENGGHRGANTKRGVRG